jgi:hypothetical protein
MLRPFGLFYGHLVYFMVIWHIFPVLVGCTKINLATLVRLSRKNSKLIGTKIRWTVKKQKQSNEKEVS